MDGDRYSDRAPSDSLRHQPPLPPHDPSNNYSALPPNDSNYDHPNESFSAQGSGYYGGGGGGGSVQPQVEDPYGSRQDYGYGAPGAPSDHVIAAGQPGYGGGDARSQSPSSDLRGEC